MPPSKLDLDMIVVEAIRLMEEEGLEAVSLRKIATRLDVRAPSLYRHFRDKDDLFALMAAKIFKACLRRMKPCDDWQAWLMEFGRVLWDEQHRATGSLQLIGRSQSDGPPKARDYADVIGPLVQFGLETGAADIAQRSVQALVTGWTIISPCSDRSDFDMFLQALQAVVHGWAEGPSALSMMPR